MNIPIDEHEEFLEDCKYSGEFQEELTYLHSIFIN